MRPRYRHSQRLFRRLRAGILESPQISRMVRSPRALATTFLRLDLQNRHNVAENESVAREVHPRIRRRVAPIFDATPKTARLSRASVSRDRVPIRHAELSDAAQAGTGVLRTDRRAASTWASLEPLRALRPCRGEPQPAHGLTQSCSVLVNVYFATGRPCACLRQGDERQGGDSTGGGEQMGQATFHAFPCAARFVSRFAFPSAACRPRAAASSLGGRGAVSLIAQPSARPSHKRPKPRRELPCAMPPKSKGDHTVPLVRELSTRIGVRYA